MVKYKQNYGYIRKKKERLSNESDLEYRMRLTPPPSLPPYSISNFISYVEFIRLLNNFFNINSDDGIILINGTLYAMTLILNNANDDIADVVERNKMKMKILMIGCYFFIFTNIRPFDYHVDDAIKNAFQLMNITYNNINVDGVKSVFTVLKYKHHFKDILLSYIHNLFSFHYEFDNH